MMIDAIKKRSENMERLREKHPKTWMELLTYFEIRMVVEDRKELVTEAVHFLERAQRAETEVERMRSKPSTIEAHRILDEASWPQGGLIDRVKRLARALTDFRGVTDDPSRDGLFRSLEKTSMALKRAQAEAREAVAREDALTWALQIVWDKREELYCEDHGALGWSIELDVREGNIVRDALQDSSAVAAMLLEQAQEILAEHRDALSLAEQREHACKATLDQAMRERNEALERAQRAEAEVKRLQQVAMKLTDAIQAWVEAAPDSKEDFFAALRALTASEKAQTSIETRSQNADLRGALQAALANAQEKGKT